MRKKTKTAKARNKFPKGWDEKKVLAVIEHYENQTDEEAIAEDEAAYKRPTHTMMEVPIELVPEVRKLIARRAQ